MLSQSRLLSLSLQPPIIESVDSSVGPAGYAPGVSGHSLRILTYFALCLEVLQVVVDGQVEICRRFRVHEAAVDSARHPA